METSAEKEVKLRLTSIISNTDDEEKIFAHSGRAKIIINDQTTAGHIEYTTFDIFHAIIDGSGNTVYQIADLDQEWFELFEQIYDFKRLILRKKVITALDSPTYLDFSGGIYPEKIHYIDVTFVSPEHRGRGLAITALKLLMLRLRSCGGLFFIKPYPLQCCDDIYLMIHEINRERDLAGFDMNKRLAIMKLARLYSLAGFKKIKNSTLMVCSGEALMKKHEN